MAHIRITGSSPRTNLTEDFNAGQHFHDGEKATSTGSIEKIQQNHVLAIKWLGGDHTRAALDDVQLSNRLSKFGDLRKGKNPRDSLQLLQGFNAEVLVVLGSGEQRSELVKLEEAQSLLSFLDIVAFFVILIGIISKVLWKCIEVILK